MKIVINKCYGGPSLSEEAVKELKSRGIEWALEFYNDKNVYEEWNWYYLPGDYRTDPTLIELIESNSKKYSGQCSELKVVEIPDDIEYTIENYDGIEHIAEKHNIWS